MVIRNMRGTTSAAAATIRAVGAGQRQGSFDHAGGLRSRVRARYVPDIGAAGRRQRSASAPKTRPGAPVVQRDTPR